MRPGFAATWLEGPYVHDLIGTHQGDGGLVKVGLDVQIGGGQGLVTGQLAIHQTAAKVIQFGVSGELLIIQAWRVLVQLPVMMGSPDKVGMTYRPSCRIKSCNT